jgi:hypothetical protein
MKTPKEGFIPILSESLMSQKREWSLQYTKQSLHECCWRISEESSSLNEVLRHWDADFKLKRREAIHSAFK